MTRIIAIANHKGGVGKTTSAASIGSCLAGKGFKTLLIDLAGQANLTSYFFLEEDEDRNSVFDTLVNDTALPIYSIKENLDMVPSSLEMAGAEVAMTNIVAREQLLNIALKPIKANYDYILIDCPPSIGIVTTNAFLAATEILVPMTPELLPLKGMSMLESFVESLRRIKPELKINGVFITRFNNRKLNKVVETALKERYSDITYQTKIRENISVAESAGSGSSIFEYDTESNGAKDYAALTEEIIAKI